jgi:integrase
VRHAGAYTVKDAVDAYVEYLDGRPSAFDTKKRLFAYAIPSFGDRPVAELEVDEIRNWHRSIAKHGARQRTAIGRPQNYAQLDADDPKAVRKRQVSANRCLSLLRAALNHAWYSDKVKCEKVWAKVKPFKGVDIPRARYLTVAEAQRLINASDTEFRILARAALETGARYQELARLRVKDFDPDAGTLHVRKSKTNRDKHIILTLDEGVPFFASLAAGRKGSHPLLGREWKPGQQDTPMKVACKRAGIEPPVPFHVLRHTYASLSVMNGTPLMVVAKNLGHVDTRMVEKHYGHLAAGFISDAIRAGAPRFGNVAGNVKAIR